MNCPFGLKLCEKYLKIRRQTINFTPQNKEADDSLCSFAVMPGFRSLIQGVF